MRGATAKNLAALSDLLGQLGYKLEHAELERKVRLFLGEDYRILICEEGNHIVGLRYIFSSPFICQEEQGELHRSALMRTIALGESEQTFQRSPSILISSMSGKGAMPVQQCL